MIIHVRRRLLKRPRRPWPRASSRKARSTPKSTASTARVAVADTPEEAFEEAKRKAKVDLLAEFEAQTVTV